MSIDWAAVMQREMELNNALLTEVGQLWSQATGGTPEAKTLVAACRILKDPNIPLNQACKGLPPGSENRTKAKAQRIKSNAVLLQSVVVVNTRVVVYAKMESKASIGPVEPSSVSSKAAKEPI